MECICGLDHNKPLPKKFEAPPIVYSSYDEMASCHACGGFWKIGEDEKHFINCEYLEYLKTKPIK